MKTTIFFVMFCYLWINVMAQVPQALKYQAVVRDNTGQIMENKTVYFKISILSQSPTGVVVYSENHTGKTTNAFGLVDLEIGKGTPELGLFSSINWSSGSYFIKVAIFPPGATAWQEMGTNQLLSVPYALYAKDVQNNNDADANPTNEIQKLSISGTILTLDNGGGSVTLPTSGTGGDNWGTQVVKTNMTLTGQGTDASPLAVANAEIQPDWSKVQNKPAGFADGIDNVDDADNSVTNEIQKLSISGTVLTLDNGGGSVTLPASGTGGDNWGTQVVKTTMTLTGQGTDASPLGVASNEILPDWSKVQNKPSGFADGIDNVDDADNSVTNEIQTLTLTGSTLSISGGNAVTLPPATGDNWGTQTALTDATLAGNGALVSPLKIAQQSAVSGQVLKWNGTTWAPSADETTSGTGINPVGPAGGDLAGTYPNPLIGDGKVTSAKIVDGTVANADLADNSVTAAKIQDGAVAGADIADNAVNSAKIIDGSIVTADLANSTVTTDKLGNLAVSAEKIQNAAVLADKLAANAVTTEKINAGAVTGAKIAHSDAISGQVLKWNGTIWAPANDETGSGGSNPTGPAGGDLAGIYPNPSIGDGKVTSAKIVDGTVANADLADNSVTTAKIQDGGVASADIADNAVNSAKIIDGSIVTADLANSTVTTDKLGNLAVSAEKIQNAAVLADKLAANAVTTEKINAGAVTGAKIAQSDAISGQVLKWNGSSWSPGSDQTGTTNPGGTTGQVQFNNAGAFGGDINFVWDNTNNRLGIGTSSPDYPLQVKTSDIRGIYSITSSASGKGVFGGASATSGYTTGVYGNSMSSTGKGVEGYASATEGINYGVYGESASVMGYGVYGKSTAIANGIGVYGQTSSPDGKGVQGVATVGACIGVHGVGNGAGSSIGILGESASQYGTGVCGKSAATTGPTFGVKGDANSSSGYGVYGSAPKYGVYGESSGSSGRAVMGESSGISSIGVYGKATNTSCTGVWGEGANQGVYGISALTSGKGIYGYASATSGLNYGVYGETESSSGRGVFGYANSTGGTNYGVYGQSDSNVGIGIFGYCPATTGTTFGVVGYVAAPDGYSGYFTGDKFFVSGDVGIGTTNPSQKLDVNGVARIRGMMTGVVSTTVYRTSDGTLITGSSDIRLKENIEPLKNCLEKVMRLNGVTFTWKADPNKKQSIGFIAQDFEKVVPDLVFTNETDGYKGINYAEVSAVLAEAIKELKAENDQLKERLDKLESLLVGFRFK